MRMLNLVKYEFSKLWSFGYVRFLLVLLLIVNIVASAVYCEEFLANEKSGTEFSYSRDDVFYVHKLRENDPEWFEEEYTNITTTWNAWMDGDPPVSVYSGCDWWAFEHVYVDVHAYDNYISSIQSTVREAEYMLHISESYNSSALEATKEYQQHVIDIYSELLEEVEPYSGTAYGWRAFFSFSTLSVVLFLWTLIVSVTVFNEHITSGFAPISRICKNGRLKTALAKLIVLVLVIVLSVALFILSAMLVIELRIGFTGGGSPIQLLGVHITDADKTSYTYVPLNLSIRGYAIVNAGMKCLVLFAFAALVVFITSAINQFFGYASGIALFLWQYSIANAPVLTMDQWRKLNLISICRDNEFLVRLREVTINESSVDLLDIALVGLPIAFVLFSAFAVVCFSVRRNGGRQAMIIRKLSLAVQKVKTSLAGRIKRRYPMTLCSYEIRKSRIAYMLWAVLVVVMWYVTSEYYQPPNTSYDRMYGEIVETYKGEYTDEKAADINEKYNEYQRTVNEFETYIKAFQDGEIPERAFANLYEKYLVAMSRLPVYRDLDQQSLYLKRTPGGWYFYDTGVLAYASRGNDWGALVFILILGAGMFLPEYKKRSSESSTIFIIRATKRGRRSFVNTKLGLTLISVLIASVVANVTEIYCYLQNYDTFAMNAPMRSIMEYKDMPSWLTVGDYFVLTMVLSVIGSLIIALIVFAISCIGERAVTVYALVTVLMIPYASVMLGMEFMSYADLTRLSDAQRIVALTEKSGLSGTAIYYVAAATAALAALRAVRIKTERKA